MTFTKWLDTFLSEKGVNLDHAFEVDGRSGPNFMEVSYVVNAIKATSSAEQAKIKATFVQIDFRNGDVMHFIKHLAKAIAI